MQSDISKLYFLNGTLRENKQSDYPYLWLLRQGLNALGVPIPGFSTEYNIVVDKQYTGNPDINISATGLSSTNSSYNEQVAKAKLGRAPFPTIWDAQEFAKPLAAQGIVTNIVIKAGNIYTVGSPVLIQNGDVTGSILVNQEPDVKVANTDAAKRNFFSIGQRNINYIFEPNSGVTNICKSYQIALININKLLNTTDPIINNRYTDILPWNTNIYGEGQFKWLFGQNQGFSCRFFLVSGIPGLNMKWEADLVMKNMYQTIAVTSFTKLDLVWDKLWTYESQMDFTNQFEWAKAGLTKPYLGVTVRDYRRGQQLFTGLGPSQNDYWYGLLAFGYEGLNAVFNFKTVQLTSYNPFAIDFFYFLFSASALTPTVEIKNNSIVFNIDVFKQRQLNADTVSKAFNSFAAIPYYAGGQTTPNKNNHFTFNINQVETQRPLGSTSYCLMGMNDSTLTYNIKDYVKSTSSLASLLSFDFRGSLGATVTNSVLNVGNQITIRGKFISELSVLPILVPTDWITPANMSVNFISIKFNDVIFIKKAGISPILLSDGGSGWSNGINLSIKDAELVTDGVYSIESLNAVNVHLHDVQGSAALDALVTPIGGTLTVVSTLANYNKQ